MRSEESESAAVVEKEFKVNEYITLKLENVPCNGMMERRTNIYVGGEFFRLCKKILITDLPENLQQREIQSIDQFAKIYYPDTELYADSLIDSETEFWGHSSNLQAWVENDYDTDVIHSNLGFPLLKRLVELGDMKAKRVFKEEIAKKVKSRYMPSIGYLYTEGFMEYLTREEFWALFDLGSELEEIEKLCGSEFNLDFKDYDAQNQLSFLIEEEAAIGVEFYKCEYAPEVWAQIFQLLTNLKNLKSLKLINSNLGKIPEDIKYLTSLEALTLRNCQIKAVPDYISELINLKKVYLDSNSILSIGALYNMEKLEIIDVHKNSDIRIEDRVFDMKNLKSLIICDEEKAEKLKDNRKEKKMIVL